MELSERIRKIRKAYNLTQADIACRLDIAPSSYGQIERNAIKASCHTLLKVANAIGVSLTFLVDIESRKFVEDKNTG
jgi:transcriptional regulator with XRE-family HTH domain